MKGGIDGERNKIQKVFRQLSQSPDFVGSPNCLENRTFTIVLCLDKTKKPKKERIFPNYRNPLLYVAKEYAGMIETGEARSESDLARKMGISRVRVNHFIRLLKLDASIILTIEKLGEPLTSRMITERMLRPYVCNLKKLDSLIKIISTIPCWANTPKTTDNKD